MLTFELHTTQSDALTRIVHSTAYHVVVRVTLITHPRLYRKANTFFQCTEAKEAIQAMYRTAPGLDGTHDFYTCIACRHNFFAAVLTIAKLGSLVKTFNI